MVGVPAHSVAADVGQDIRPTVERMLVLFEDQNAGAFSYHEAVALTVPRARRPLGLVVTLRKRTHGRKAADAQRRDAGLPLAADHHVRSRRDERCGSESPTQCALVVQAVAVAEFGPLAPVRMEMNPDARLMMVAGMKNGEIR